MSKKIAVWGSSGAGKSMLCCSLAKVLTKDHKHKAIIISGDQNTPMLPVWLPDQIVEVGNSVGHVLTSLEIDMAITAQHVVVLKRSPYIGVMGYAAKETPLSYPEIKYESIKELIENAARLVDYVILDCSTSMTNIFTPASIESADLVCRVLTPDLRGINYLQAQQALLRDSRFKFSEHMNFAGLARPYHAIDEMGHLIGGFDGLLPYSKEVDRCATEGGMFDALGYMNKKYIKSLQAIVEKLIDEPDEDDTQEDEQNMREETDAYEDDRPRRKWRGEKKKSRRSGRGWKRRYDDDEHEESEGAEWGDEDANGE